MEQHPVQSMKQSIMFSHKVAQLSKALWKSIEKDWQTWIKPYNLNINEHHILWIAYQLEGASISDIAKFGVMHVSTAFNFSKKLEERGLLTFSKRQTDKRNTYIYLTAEGESLLIETFETYNPNTHGVYSGSLPIKDLYGKFPEFSELISIVKHIYGPDFISTFEKSLSKIDDDFIEEEGKLIPLQKNKEASS
ncbi:HTH-type transcriptional regulator Hpr [Salipaludibacillus agaradhaerens]|jgi:MarR family protease production transcriptional regulator HPr|uniref:HTH-type transcriptional regulator Hpr n=1 Tax=Salipaludibacillus agaradhaerens TaxID=76935 RepID=A0A9Q4B2A8_SALAG|nr:HTH-type transcriptional regulator Hpr [Salipaludibacillus agaradhaerens]UJW57310.1 HTH-type transcriptional regulator Hpr [Bacillus sp. A116_S68]MCR6097014.1 HTH-type transcriptional regulator Hpr [Salipaludibacillus agaradhaerens]MCR6106159.1 HTH-type transcriptional regulator Hpr [Salipaludibacillus agaradhaerens]MCR6113501.1 HTH-type transcriptional regulator Hpr [Salipaludibacillus agaradhaerens]MCR6118192.1 HTH-type transcriptional regulator Hpr [Salipaludibacillus agaradhaerens]